MTGPTQLRNDENSLILANDLRQRNSVLYSAADIRGICLNIPGIVGYWPGQFGDSAGNSTNLTEFSGKELHLTSAGNPTWEHGNALASFAHYDGTTDRHFSTSALLNIRGDEAHIESTQRGLSMGCFVHFDNAIGSDEGIMGKWLSTGNQRNYRMYRLAGGGLRFQVSSDGTAITTVDNTGDSLDGGNDPAYAIPLWYYVAARFSEGTELKSWAIRTVFGAQNTGTNTTSIPSLLFGTSTAEFEIGALENGGGSFMTGDVCHAWVSEMALPEQFLLAPYYAGRNIFGP